ncbi:hypothetical protein GCM10022225_54960 [Plantactinospora mayteni]|uniref:ATP-grasp domain-containing protein n=1 Tax=Plantactinospora mayteni TaxID=566021 RepID=A0ABQ4EK74_9ACTN|nr:acetate--CoA ligase family protein [Plantactinospora mayteni]GIG95115.1 hypothetical protein Pma05_16880 [Plantactinospora mayteni]
MFVQAIPGADALAIDGGIVRIRAVMPQDRDRLTELYRRSSPESLRMRFFALPGERTIAAEVDRLCRPASPAEHGAVLAETAGQLAGVASYGIPVVPALRVESVADALAAADGFGYPVALKAADPDLVHKSDVGGVALHLTGPEQLRAAYPGVSGAAGPAGPVLVQPMARGQLELVAGVVHDPQFGSLVMIGLGGVHTDLLGDRSLRLTPVTDLDAGRMWRSLRAAPLLTGYRGAPPVDTAAVQDLLCRLGRLAEDLPEVAELDLNPVLVGPDGVAVVDAKLRLAPVGAEPDRILRHLRAAG